MNFHTNICEISQCQTWQLSLLCQAESIFFQQAPWSRKQTTMVSHLHSMVRCHMTGSVLCQQSSELAPQLNVIMSLTSEMPPHAVYPRSSENCVSAAHAGMPTVLRGWEGICCSNSTVPMSVKYDLNLVTFGEGASIMAFIFYSTGCSPQHPLYVPNIPLHSTWRCTWFFWATTQLLPVLSTPPLEFSDETIHCHHSLTYII